MKFVNRPYCDKSVNVSFIMYIYTVLLFLLLCLLYIYIYMTFWNS